MLTSLHCTVVYIHCRGHNSMLCHECESRQKHTSHKTVDCTSIACITALHCTVLYCTVITAVQQCWSLKSRLHRPWSWALVMLSSTGRGTHQALRFRGLCCSCSQLQNWALCKPRFESNSINSQKEWKLAMRKVKIYNRRRENVFWHCTIFSLKTPKNLT